MKQGMYKNMKTLIITVTSLVILIPILLHYDIFKKIKNVQKNCSQNQQQTSIEENDTLKENQLKDSFDTINMWIGVADQKAGVLLATLGVAYTILMTSDALKVIRNLLIKPFLQYIEQPDMYEYNFPRCMMFVLLLITGVMSIISLFYLLNVLRPNIDYEKFYKDNPDLVPKSYIYYSTVAKMKYADFKSDKLNYEEDLRSQVFVNATIADKKFKNYLEGFFWFKMMLLSAAMLFISVMFVQ